MESLIFFGLCVAVCVVVNKLSSHRDTTPDMIAEIVRRVLKKL